MTATPPPAIPSNQLVAALQQLNATVRHATKPSVIGRNKASYDKLISASLDLTDVIGNVTKVINGMDGLQKKSLALGTNASKFMADNTTALKKLRGGLLENAEELFKNFDSGIRDNSDSLVLLQNRMRLTGQNTEASRKVSLNLLNTTGNNIKSVDRLMKSNMELSKASLMTNESLLDLVESMSDLAESKSLFGLSEQFSELVQMFGAQAGPGSEGMVQEVLKFMTSQDFLAQRQSIGLKEIDLSKGVTESFKDLMGNLSKTEQFKSSFIGKNNDGVSQQLKSLALNEMGLQQGITNSVNLLNKMNNLTAPSQALMTREDKYYDSFENYKNEAVNFYAASKDFYGGLISYTPAILTTLTTIQGLMAAKEAGSWISNAANSAGGMGRILGTVARFIAPIAVVGGVIGLMAHATSDRAGIVEAMKLNARAVKDNTRVIQESTKKPDNGSAPTVHTYMKQTLYQVNETLMKQRNADAQRMQQAQEANDLLRRINKSLDNSGPSTGKS